MTLDRRAGQPDGRRRPRVQNRIQVRPVSRDGGPPGPPQPLLPHFQRRDRIVTISRPAERKRGRHAAPVEENPIQFADRRFGVALTALCAAIIASLVVLPAVAPQVEWTGSLRLPLIVLTGIGAAALVAVGWARRRVIGLWIFSGMVIWTAGTVAIVGAQVRGTPTVPDAGHWLWLAAMPMIAVGLRRAKLPGTRRPHNTTMLLLDAGMMACSWLALLWRQFFWQGQVQLQDANWPAMLTIGVELLAMFIVLTLVADAGDRGAGISVVSMALLAAHDVIVASAAVSRATPPVDVDGAALPLLLAWGFAAFSPLLVKTTTVTESRVLSSGDSWRGLVTLTNVLIPIGMVLGGLAASLQIDRVSLTLLGLVVLSFGVRELVRARQAQGLVGLLADQALHDPLTGLGNRRALADRIDELTRQPGPVTVLTLDVDRFKLVNTEFGHTIGDDVLAAVGAALKETCHPVGAQAFRLGGDEFAAIAVGDVGLGLDLADRVRSEVLRRTNEVPGVANLALTASVGVAPLDPHERDPLAVLGRSAEALRVAKLDRNRVRLYTSDLANQSARRNQMEQRLRRAIDAGAMVFHYQPIVDLRSGRIMGLEALARWDDPDLGSVSPADFVPIAEQTGMIHDLGRMAIESALRVMTHGAVADSPVGYVAVNVSPLQLRRPQFVQEVSDMVIDLRAQPGMLKLEVTEGIFMDTDDPAVENLRRLSELGIGIAIDDFGSGYSSLGYMSRLPVETVKVDRLLTSQVEDARTRSVVKALVWVAEAHGLQVILEGVENEQTAATLRRLGVRWGQGWLFSRAVPAEQLPEVLNVLGTVPLRHRFQSSASSRAGASG